MTMGGQAIQQAAKGAAEKTGDSRRGDDDKRNDKEHAEKVSNDRDKEAQTKSAQEAAAEDRALEVLRQLKEAGVKISTNPSENEHIVRVFKNDNPNLNQIGWAFMSLSPNGNNFTAVSLANDTKSLVVVTQDRLTDAFNFAGQYNRPQGSIIINQSYK
jgi:hypothetical protein